MSPSLDPTNYLASLEAARGNGTSMISLIIRMFP